MTKRLLCFLGIHWRVIEGGGAMGDALKCTTCGRDKYPEAFGIRIFKEPLQ